MGVDDSQVRRSHSEKKRIKHLDSIVRLQAYMKAWKYNSSFEVLDRKYLMPFFTLQTEYGNGSRGYSKMSMDLELTDQGKSDESVAHDDNQLETLSSGDEEVDVEGQGQNKGIEKGIEPAASEEDAVVAEHND